MTRLLFATAFLLGAAAIGWTGFDFAGSNGLAFTVTAVIGGVYLIGIIELLQFRRATATLGEALGTIAPKTDNAGEWLEQWLNRLDPSLRNAARLRIEGERAGLPAPVFTPYLVGLLVMLGLLGTFVGMVNTLNGAVLALQGSTELETIRAGLAAPIQGLGVAFGTSVAGVSASAMLGLISTLVRRDRMLATRLLDGKITTVFRDFSLAHNRHQAFAALQTQARALPAVADQLQAVAAQLALMGDKLGTTLVTNQDQFHESTGKQFTALADSVDRSLRESLAASGQAAGASIKPVVAEAMAGISQLAQDTHRQLASTAREQLHSFGETFNSANSSVLEAFAKTSSAWAEQALALQESLKQSMADSTRELTDSARTTSAGLLTEIGVLLQSTEALVQARTVSEAGWLDSQGERMEQLTAALTTELGKLRSQEEQGHAAAISRLAELESAVAGHLTQLGKGLEEPMTRLIETASETPRAAAEVIGQLRAEITNNVERDNQLLEERQRVMEELNALSASLQQASTGQREAVEKLVESSADMLQDISTRFGDHILAEVAKIADASTHVAGGAIELSSLGEAFGLAVELFNSSNGAMIEHLTRIEESMERSGTRSDDQMAYYVAQAREIIDQSMLSQKEIIEDMRRLKRGGDSTGEQSLHGQVLEAEAG
jgi:hypothetical protein